MFPMKYMLPNVGPKFGESVAAHPSYKAEKGPHARIIYAGDTVCTPSVRKEVASGFTDISGVSRSQTPIGPPRGECHHQNVLDSTFEGLIGGAKIPRIFVPQRAKTGLQRAAGSDTSQPHAVALAESVPVRSIFLGCVPSRRHTRQKQPRGETFGTHGALYDPVESLPYRDWT